MHLVMEFDVFSVCRQVREDGKDKNSVVSFTLTDEPQHIDLVPSNSKEEVRVEKCLRMRGQYPEN